MKHFYQYQQLSLSVLFFIFPLTNLLLFHFSSKKQERTTISGADLVGKRALGIGLGLGLGLRSASLQT